MMRGLERNQKRFWYALCEGTEQVVDSQGRMTARHITVYDDPIECKGSISADIGRAEVMPFGADDEFDKLITVHDPDTPIDIDTAIWIGTDPFYSDNKHDYVVVRVSRSLNTTVIAVKKVIR